MNRNLLYISYSLMLSCLVLASCVQKSDFEEDGMPVSVGMLSMGDTEIVTRADGYHSYMSTSDEDPTTMIGYVQNTSTGLFTLGTSKYSSGNWVSGLRVKNYGQEYKFYGILTDYTSMSSKMELTNNVPTLTVQKIPAFSDKRMYVSRASCLSGSTLSDYSYAATVTFENHLINYRFDNMLAGLNMKFMIDEDYSKLRFIVLKEVKLVSGVDASASYSAKVEFNNTGIATTFTADGTSKAEYIVDKSADDVVLDDSNDSDDVLEGKKGFLLTTELVEYMSAYFIPAMTGISMTVTYDVYDKKGNLIREDQTAQNNLSAKALVKDGNSLVKANNYINLEIKVAPTYIYQLSNADLDNPGITIIKN